MIPDGTHTAVVDRFEDTQECRVAVLVVEGEHKPLGDLLVEPAELPEEACHRDAVLQVTIKDGDLRETVYSESETCERQEDAQSRFDRLARRPPSDEEE